eukprot:CAMPEP_0196687978 /NCGR_PEP_ID=MMETSP1090-20130531/15736_1 /TAXON_ID=37098 /ORGANISM="Isochrysis sp, Strain CCMP1244" /LENGTH=110 /DNA_ID=CAMNT_0042026827 /DNA_START=34 /DNA_END=363 /DNA_ORIENTATION=+
MQYQINVPPGVQPGQRIQANVGGQMVQVQVPLNLGPDRLVRITVPAAAPPPQPQQFRVTVPPGCGAGSVFQANVGGRLVQITVPPGQGPGSQLMVNAPPPGPAAPQYAPP